MRLGKSWFKMFLEAIAKHPWSLDNHESCLVRPNTFLLELDRRLKICFNSRTKHQRNVLDYRGETPVIQLVSRLKPNEPLAWGCLRYYNQRHSAVSLAAWWGSYYSMIAALETRRTLAWCCLGYSYQELVAWSGQACSDSYHPRQVSLAVMWHLALGCLWYYNKRRSAVPLAAWWGSYHPIDSCSCSHESFDSRLSWKLYRI